MVNFTREELIKIASLSSLQLDSQELISFVNEIKVLLEYIEQLNEIELFTGKEPIKTINVLREDKTIISDSLPLLNQAPETKQNYFVVPKILDQ